MADGRKRFNTLQWTIEDTEANRERERKLIVYARRIGLGQPFRDSFEEEDAAYMDRIEHQQELRQ